MTQIDCICENVNKLINKYDTRSPFEICWDMNIHIHYMDLGTALKAYYFYQSRIKNIVINSRSGAIVKRILCGHELGHAVLHGKLAAMKGFQELELFDSLVPTEYEANLFAAELIIPDDDLLELLNDKDKSFFGIAKELYVPAELLDFKFRVLKNKGYQLESPVLFPSDFLKRHTPNDFQPTQRTDKSVPFHCRIVKDIGQRTRLEKASEEASWESCWSGGCGQRADFQSR